MSNKLNPETGAVTQADNTEPGVVNSSKKARKAIVHGTTENTTRKDKKAFMYLGPNLPGGIAFTGSVYKEIPEHLLATLAGHPEIEKLFVEVKNAPAFKKELIRQGSEAFRLYQCAEALIRRGDFNNDRL